MANIVFSIGNAIEEALHDKRISKAELARRLNLHAPSISALVSHKANPTMSSLLAVAEAIDVPPFFLLMTKEERDRWRIIIRPNSNSIEARIAALESKLSQLMSPTLPGEGRP